jgi:threonine/homoserine/homoserine lactone efflux protein
MWLKWVGVAYLLYLGLKSWHKGIQEWNGTSANKKPLRTLFWQGLLLATINPKTMLFNAAFLPQFVGRDAGFVSLLSVAVIYLGVIFLGDLVWAFWAQSARSVITKFGRLQHRLTGCLLFGAGIGLALARIDR